MLESSTGVLETRTDNSAVELHQTDEYFQSNNEVKNSVSTGHYGDQSKIPRDEKFETSEKTSISREADLGSRRMESDQGIGELVSDPWLERNTSRFVGALAESQKVHFVTGSSYEGTWDALGMAGVGRYVLPNGTIYEGEIRDGMFHGQGSFYWSENQRLDVVHFRGELKDYRYQYQDGLNYEDADWKYCKFPDRRFYESIKNGLKPGGRTLKTARQTAKVLPAGCYDAGDGVFDPTTQRITSYDDSTKTLRFPSAEEYAWILKKCRKSWSEPTGYRPELNENWSDNPPNLPYNLPMSQDSPDHWWQRLTTFTRDPNFLGGGSYETYGPGLSRGNENLSIPKVCMCCETVLIGEPCRCIRLDLSSHEGEDDKLQSTLSDEVYENEYENCGSNRVFLETDADSNNSVTHVDSIPKTLAEFSQDLGADKSPNRPRSYSTLRKSIRSLEKAKQYQANDESLKIEHLEGSKTDIELRNVSNDRKKEISERKRSEENIKQSQNVIERGILQNDNGKSFTREDDNAEKIMSAIMSNQDIEKSHERNDESRKNFGKSSVDKFSDDQKLDHSTDLITREKVSRDTVVPEASENRKLEMKLLPEHVSQQYQNQIKMEETMEKKTQRDFANNGEMENSNEIIRQSLSEHGDRSGGTIISESSAIREEKRGNFQSKSQEPNNEIKTLLDDNAEYKSQYNEQSSSEEKPKILATNTSEKMQSAENSQPDFVQNSRSILETKEKIKIHESLSSKTNTDGNLISRTFSEKLPLITTETFTEQKTLDSIVEKDSNDLFNNISTVALENKPSNHDKESSIESKNKFYSNDVKRLKSIEKSQVELIDADRSLSESGKNVKTYISTSSRTMEIPETIPGQKSAVTLNLKTMEKSSSTGFSSRWEETKGSMSLDREESRSLNKLHPSLASLKTTRQELSKEKKLVEIYNKHSNKKEPTYEPMNSNVWRLSSAKQNYGPETKIKNLLFHPALTSPRSENVVYVRKPCDHRACRTLIREVRASESRTGKEYPSIISSKTLSAHSNVNVKK